MDAGRHFREAQVPVLRLRVCKRIVHSGSFTPDDEHLSFVAPADQIHRQFIGYLLRVIHYVF